MARIQLCEGRVLALLGDPFGQVPTWELLLDSISPFLPLHWPEWESNLGLRHLRAEGGWHSASCQRSLCLYSRSQNVFVLDDWVNREGTRACAKENSHHLFWPLAMVTSTWGYKMVLLLWYCYKMKYAIPGSIFERSNSLFRSLLFANSGNLVLSDQTVPQEYTGCTFK